MHLHGFYFPGGCLRRSRAAEDGQGGPGRWVVTERMSQFSTMSLTWVPERAGNWLFHCHFQKHVAPAWGAGRCRARRNAPAHRRATLGAPRQHPRRPCQPCAHRNGGTGGWRGGATARDAGRWSARAGACAPAAPPARGTGQRLPADRPRCASSSTAPAPARHRRPTARREPHHRPDRDEPVEITVVNRLRDPLSVHWHGIELESYFDGVAASPGPDAKSRRPSRQATRPGALHAAARGDVHLSLAHGRTPPPSRGLVGALIVRGAPTADTVEDRVFVIKSARDGADDDGVRPVASVVPSRSMGGRIRIPPRSGWGSGIGCDSPGCRWAFPSDGVADGAAG